MLSTHIVPSIYTYKRPSSIELNSSLLENLDNYQFAESVYSTDYDVITNPPTLIYINGKAAYCDEIGPRIRVYEKYNRQSNKRLPLPHSLPYVTLDGVVVGSISKSVLNKVLTYITINKVPLLQYWNSNGNMCANLFRQQVKSI